VVFKDQDLGGCMDGCMDVERGEEERMDGWMYCTPKV